MAVAASPRADRPGVRRRPIRVARNRREIGRCRFTCAPPALDSNLAILPGDVNHFTNVDAAVMASLPIINQQLYSAEIYCYLTNTRIRRDLARSSGLQAIRPYRVGFFCVWPL